MTIYQLDSFLNGDISDMIDALITSDQAKKMLAITEQPVNSNLQNKLVKFGVFLALYTFGIFVFFNFAFSKKEIKVDVTKKEETTTKTDTTLNANGIDVKKLTTKVNGGNKINPVSYTHLDVYKRQHQNCSY